MPYVWSGIGTTPAETLGRGLIELGRPVSKKLEQRIAEEPGRFEIRPGGSLGPVRTTEETLAYGTRWLETEAVRRELKETRAKLDLIKELQEHGRLETLGIEPSEVRQAMDEDRELSDFVWRCIAHEAGHYAASASVGAAPWHVRVLFDRKGGRLRCIGGRCSSMRPERLTPACAVAGPMAEAWAADDPHKPVSWRAFYAKSGDLAQFRERGGQSVQQAVTEAGPMLRRLAPGRSAIHALLRERFDLEGLELFETFIRALPRPEADRLWRLNA